MWSRFVVLSSSSVLHIAFQSCCRPDGGGARSSEDSKKMTGRDRCSPPVAPPRIVFRVFALPAFFLVAWGCRPCQNEELAIYYRRDMKTALSILLLLGFAAEAHSRIHAYFSYADLKKKSDLIVIAKPMQVHEPPKKVSRGQAGHGTF